MTSPDSAAPTPSPTVRRVGGLLGALIVVTVVPLSAVAVVLPDLAANLGLGTTESAWVLVAYALAFAVSTALFGRMIDLRGLRPPVWIGLALLTAGSVVSAAAPSFWVLLAGRVVAGLGGGAGPVLTIGTVSAALPSARRSSAFGVLTGTAGAVLGAGPLIGAVVGHLAGWRLLLALPVASIALAPFIAALGPRRRAGTGSMDLPGVAGVAAVIAGAILLVQSSAIGLGPTQRIALALAVAAVAALLVPHVRRRPDGFLPRAVVRNRALLRISGTAFTLQAANLAALFSLPLLLGGRHGWATLAIGAAMLPAGLVAAASSAIVGRRAGRRQRATLVFAGLAASAVGLLTAGWGWRHPATLVLGYTLVIGGFGSTQVLLLDTIPRVTSSATRGMAMGLFNLVFFFGAAAGPALVAALAGAVTLPAALAATAVLPALGVLVIRGIDVTG